VGSSGSGNGAVEAIDVGRSDTGVGSVDAIFGISMEDIANGWPVLVTLRCRSDANVLDSYFVCCCRQDFATRQETALIFN
jgi:hypothetical protein